MGAAKDCKVGVDVAGRYTIYFRCVSLVLGIYNCRTYPSIREIDAAGTAMLCERLFAWKLIEGL